MSHIDLLLIHIDYLHFVIIVDHFYGEHGIKECNVEVNICLNEKEINFR
jgi:23S rRNA-/tRNA-specific pseudouridylate synthase